MSPQCWRGVTDLVGGPHEYCVNVEWVAMPMASVKQAIPKVCPKSRTFSA